MQNIFPSYIMTEDSLDFLSNNVVPSKILFLRNLPLSFKNLPRPPKALYYAPQPRLKATQASQIPNFVRSKFITNCNSQMGQMSSRTRRTQCKGATYLLA